jgi:hypothetical protein
MHKHTLPKTISLALAAMMMVLTLGAIDHLAANGSPAVQMSTNDTKPTQTANVGTPVQRSSAAPRS